MFVYTKAPQGLRVVDIHSRFGILLTALSSKPILTYPNSFDPLGRRILSHPSGCT